MSTFDDLEHAEVEVAPVLAAQTTGRCGLDPSEISAAIGSAFGTLMAFVQGHGLAPCGPPRTIYTGHGPEGISFTVAVPMAAPPESSSKDGPVTVASIAGAKALRFTHHGPYANLVATYGRITQFMQAKGLMQSEADWARYMPMWEEYLNDPDTTPEADLLTYIYLPLA